MLKPDFLETGFQLLKTGFQKSHCACVSRSICLLVRALSKASTNQNRSKGPILFALPVVTIHKHWANARIYLFRNFFSQHYAIFDRKNDLKNKFKNRFSKSKTGFQFTSQKPDFRFSINIPKQHRTLMKQTNNSSLLTHKRISNAKNESTNEGARPIKRERVDQMHKTAYNHADNGLKIVAIAYSSSELSQSGWETVGT